jgi:hypothetical protein
VPGLGDDAATRSKPRRWFEAGAEVLAALAPELAPNSYACPLCGAVFSLSDLEANELTREHVPPASIGGRAMVLTCRACNNLAGSTFDAHLERAEAFRRHGTDEPLRELDVTLTVAGVPNRGRMYAGPGGVLIIGNPKQNHPNDVEAISEHFGEWVGAGHPMQVAFRDTFDPRLAQLGFVRAAYLSAFALFGYAYVFGERLAPIRAALNGELLDTFVPPVLKRSDGSSADRAIGLVSDPDWLAGAVLVGIGRTMVVLPPVDTPGDPIAELVRRRDESPQDLHGTFGLSTMWDWPTEPQHMYDRWLIGRGRTVSDPPPSDGLDES